MINKCKKEGGYYKFDSAEDPLPGKKKQPQKSYTIKLTD